MPSIKTFVIVLIFALLATFANAQEQAAAEARVKKTQDFHVTGDGSNPAWKNADWIPLNKREGGNHEYMARFKVLYSDTGIYFLMNGTDKVLTATMQNDFDDLWNEDVFEVFLWTDEQHPIYFEYEISPLNKELPIIIPNFDGKFLGWRPWHYEGDRKTKKAVKILGGEAKSGASIEGWSAEVFFPYALLNPLQNVPPKSGTRWRANVYRVDYDDKKTTQWDWARVGTSFHEYKKFGTLVFE
ncbi:MAG: carbohydrate-binding family 9-like protein [Planctomycetales bacterium]|nr:carbohydrate-binding family 9-like protein [Planctomycetales bacterium]